MSVRFKVPLEILQRQVLRPAIAFCVSVCLALFGGLTSGPAFAAEKGIGKLSSIIGKVFVVREGQKLPAKKGMQVFPSDSLVTSPKAVAKIQFDDGGSFMAFENSSVKIEEYDIKRQGDNVSLKSAFDIAKGKVRFFVKPGENRKTDAKYKTKNAVMGIRGTSGYIDTTTPGKTQLVVTTGKVSVSNPLIPGQSVLVPANQMTDVVGNSAPTPPKAAPAELLNNLEAKTEQSGGRGEPENESRAEAAQEKSDEKKPDEKKPDEQKPDEQKPDEQKPDEKKPDEKKPDEKKGSSQENDAEKNKSSGKANSDGQGAAPGRPDEKGAAPGRPDGPASSADGKAQNRDAAPVKRVTVFGQDGSSSVSVSDQSSSQFATRIETGVGSVKPTNQAGGGGAVLQKTDLTSAATNALKQVEKATNTEKIQEQIKASVEEAMKQTTTAIEAAKPPPLPQETVPATKNVKVKIVLPSE